MAAPSIVWLRQDLRVEDNPALTAAAERGRPVLPLFVLDEDAPGRWAPGGATRWWLHGSLESLGSRLRAIGAPLILRRGPATRILPELIKETVAGAVFWNRCYEPFAIERDRGLKQDLRARGVEVASFNASLLFEPWTVMRGDGRPFCVYSPFARACRAGPQPPAPLPAPSRLPAPEIPPRSDDLAAWALLPRQPDWAHGLRATWQPGEAGSRARLDRLLDGGIGRYGSHRHRPDLDVTSRLSPHLRSGEIGPRQVWHALERARETAPGARGFGSYARELLWREFAHHLLFHHTDMPERALDPPFDDVPWRQDPQALVAWQHGRTGYPMVDAGMRQLRETGWMHNRVRMIVGSFLTKDLLLPWREGAAWFWDNLVDADLANNSLGWQWVASTGPDAAPYLRIANPVSQAEKFDPDGAYVRRFIPELAGLPAPFIHKPWQAPATLLGEADVRLGDTYPRPIVDHKVARERALAAYATVRPR